MVLSTLLSQDRIWVVDVATIDFVIRIKVVMKGAIIILASTMLILSLGCQTNKTDFLNYSGLYFNQEPPDGDPQPFLHNLFCQDYSLHGPPIFSPDGSEVYWTPMNDYFDGIYVSKKTKDTWTNPTELSLPFLMIEAGEPFISPDGKRLYFTAHKLFSDEMIFYAERQGDRWGDPVSVSDKINSLNLHWQISVNSKYDLYFQVRNEDLSDGMIYCSKYINDEYQDPVKLNNNINTDAWENFPYISSDDSYLIFSRETREAGDDLFISFRDENGEWGEAINMKTVNSPYHDMYPNITPDGNFLIFLSWRDGKSCPYWVSSRVIEDLRSDR